MIEIVHFNNFENMLFCYLRKLFAFVEGMGTYNLKIIWWKKTCFRKETSTNTVYDVVKSSLPKWQTRRRNTKKTEQTSECGVKVIFDLKAG